MISAIALATALSVSPACSWDNPGANRYTGDVPAAVHHYTDIPKDVRDKLQARMEKKQYDEVADITKDNISGGSDYTNLRDMHFGANKVCTTVSRDKWKPLAKERGLVYCEAEHCIIVPTVCGNVSRVTRVNAGGDAGGYSGIPGGPGFTAPPSFSFAPLVLPPEPTFASVASADPLPPPIITPVYPWFPPIYDPWWPPGGGSCCLPEVVPPPIPEPPAILLMLIGILGLMFYKRHKNNLTLTKE
jgi:hypothetical protein